MDSKNCNQKSEAVRLQQILKKWKKPANVPKNGISHRSNSNVTSIHDEKSRSKKGINFLKRTLSLPDISTYSTVPKGYLAVCVGQELKRFTIPTEFLRHQSFRILLREAEEEFGFQQEGVLKIPCEVSIFETILKMVEQKRDAFFLHESGFNSDIEDLVHSFSSESDELASSHHSQMCR